jgi:hypothetical protein
MLPLSIGKEFDHGQSLDTDSTTGEVECLKHDEETDTWVTRVAWGVGKSKEEVKLTGLDIVTVIGGKIKACYTFLDVK